MLHRKFFVNFFVLSCLVAETVPVTNEFTLAFENFRSLPDGSWEGNTGAFASACFGVPIPYLRNGFGMQFGGSYGLYDWAGRSSTLSDNKSLQTQAFATLGLFRIAPERRGISAGVAYDWMINQNFGLFAVSPNIAQMRAQLGYSLCGCDELGLWTAWHVHTSHQESEQIPLLFRAVNQVNFFWYHSFKNQAQFTLWAGSPFGEGLLFSPAKRAGTYLFGARFKAPLTASLSVVGHGAYMGPHESPNNSASNVCLGLTYSFGGIPSTQGPYLPLADNSNFLVDTNVNN